MLDKPPTVAATLIQAREIAMARGLRYVYTGNVRNRNGSITWCPLCSHPLIERDGYALRTWNLQGNRCANCGWEIAGHFDEKPGTWGNRRQMVLLD